ncbi:hypothetical protein SAMN05216232_1952 [Virgibacillus subterraneus]|uniref:Uncharacterized protein n=1 Tax=Virgibacillus subterraneus TaxID=621109 RepID=A0A1H9EA27_9BACI|nr:hypothetical protein [Virgibacillus subterraneus]SEQ22505.1 hypothetical protein SAMN05216232_1952 [Virgibacillus subterraneus]
MKTEMLQRFEKQFVEVMEGREPVRSKRLTNLMARMEKALHIPMIRRDDYLQQNKEVMDLYVKVSLARNLEGVR